MAVNVASRDAPAVLGFSVLLRAVAAVAAGLLTATALPPWGFLPGLVGLATFVFLVRLSADRRQAFLFGWCFGLGWFGLGLYWVAIAFYTDAERFGAWAVPAVMALAATCALFVAGAAWLVRVRVWRSPIAFALAFAVAWTFLEELRGSWGVGFPWNPLGLVWASSDPMLQLAAWVGAPGLTLLTALIAALPVSTLDRHARARGPILAVGLLILALGFGFGRLALLPLPSDTGVPIRLVQANVAQHHKWDPELRTAWFRRYLSMSGHDAAAAVLWPESAVPYRIDGEPVVRDLMADVAGHGYLLAGGDYFEFASDPPVAHNSLWAVNGEAEVVARYDKVNLVPFGEYLPARAVLGRIGLEKLTAGTFDFAPGSGRRTISIGTLPSFSPLICYEAIYSGEATLKSGPRPAWLLNITNDAWFGDSWGPYQHLAMARTRAVEEGLPLVRAANTGISVVTDAFGRVRERLNLGETGVIDAVLPGHLEEPLYTRAPFAVTMGLLLLAVLMALAAEWRKVAGTSPGR